MAESKTRVNIYLDPALHERLKNLAASKNTSVSDLLAQFSLDGMKSEIENKERMQESIFNLGEMIEVSIRNLQNISKEIISVSETLRLFAPVLHHAELKVDFEADTVFLNVPSQEDLKQVLLETKNIKTAIEKFSKNSKGLFKT